jgi:transcriptional regulator with XRE-family HTH domain
MALVISNPAVRIGRKIEDARRAARLSQAQLATAAGVSRSKLSRLETGDATVKLGDVVAVVNALARAGSAPRGLL